MDDFKARLVRDRFDKRLVSKQQKKDECFAPADVFVVRELTVEELRQERDRKYLEDNFPDLETIYEKRVRFGN